jgi:hypothetical protein
MNYKRDGRGTVSSSEKTRTSVWGSGGLRVGVRVGREEKKEKENLLGKVLEGRRWRKGGVMGGWGECVESSVGHTSVGQAGRGRRWVAFTATLGGMHL